MLVSSNSLFLLTFAEIRRFGQNFPNWWVTQGLVPTYEAHDASVGPPEKLKTPREASLDVYYDLLAHDPNQRYSGLSENDVEELRQIMTEMDGVQVTSEEAWGTARSLLEMTWKMLEWEVNQPRRRTA